MKRSHRRRIRIQFDPKNILQTNPLVKDYGLEKVNQTTPYPRSVDPISPRILRKRLEKLLEDLNINSRDSRGRFSVVPSFPSTLASTPSFGSSDTSLCESEGQKSLRVELFKKKRQEFCRHEFTIAKQRNMNYLKQQPGTSNRKDRAVPELDAVSLRATQSFEAKMDSLIAKL